MARTKNLGQLRDCQIRTEQQIIVLQQQAQQASQDADVTHQQLQAIRKEFRQWQKLRSQYRWDCKEVESRKSEHWQEYFKIRKKLQHKIGKLHKKIELQSTLKQAAANSRDYYTEEMAERRFFSSGYRQQLLETIASYQRDVVGYQVEIEILGDIIRQLADEISNAREVAEWVTRPAQQRLQEAVQKCRQLRRELEQIEQRHDAQVSQAKSLREELAQLEKSYQRICQRVASAEQRQLARKTA